MKWRWAQKEDFTAIRELHRKAGYRFECPDLASEKLISSWVATQDGRIVAWAGAQEIAEVISIMDPEFGSPHERQKLFATLHAPVAWDHVRDAGYEKAVCHPVERYRFGRCLTRMGWFRGWPELPGFSRRRFWERNDLPTV